MAQNSIILRASIAFREQLRYTPAGVAVLDFTVDHHSRQMEAGQSRNVVLTLDCVAIGDKAETLNRISPDSALELRGFLGNRSSKSRWVVFHVTEFELK